MSKEDLRQKIHRLISSLNPLDNIEKEHIRFALDWIESGSEIFRIEKPGTPDIHLVSYFVIASPEMNQILLVDHKKAELWLPPGEHVDPGEDPKETVRREAKEELGIDAEFLFDEPLLLTVTKTVGNVARHTDVSLWYLLKGDPSQVLDYDPNEFHQIHWFGINEIPVDNTDPHMKRFIEKMLRNQTWKSYESSACDYARNVECLHPHKEVEKFLSLIPPGGSIIDIGCGSGRDVKKFSEHGFHVTGIDFSPIMKCTHYAEWEVAKRLRNKYFFDPLSIADPYTWTFDHPEHVHLVLYKGVEVIGYAHIQFWPEYRAALRIIVIDEGYRQHGLGSQFLQLCEQSLKKQGIKSLHDEARPNVVSFYRKNGYTEMPFEDPSGEPPSSQDIAMGKNL